MKESCCTKELILFYLLRFSLIESGSFLGGVGSLKGKGLPHLPEIQGNGKHIFFEERLEILRFKRI